MRLREADRFSDTDCRLLMVDSKRFCIAPRLPRMLLIVDSAASTRVIAVLAFATVVTDALLSAALPRASEPPVPKPMRAGALPPIVIVSAAVRRIDPTAVRVTTLPSAAVL